MRQIIKCIFTSIGGLFIIFGLISLGPGIRSGNLFVFGFTILAGILLMPVSFYKKMNFRRECFIKIGVLFIVFAFFGVAILVPIFLGRK